MARDSARIAGFLLAASLALAPLAATARDAPSPAQARAFVEAAETELAAANLHLGRAQWVQATHVTVDTVWLLARADAANTELRVRYAREAARFDGAALDGTTRRKLDLIKRGLVLAAPGRTGAAQDLADLSARMTAAYDTAKFPHAGRTIALDEAEDLLRRARDPAETRALWEGWHSAVAPGMPADYARLVALANEGARELGHADTGALWRSWYDMPPERFAAVVEALWEQVAPLYRDLHCYVRARLNARYGEAVQPASGPIRADLTGDMWALQWSNIADIVAPLGLPAPPDLDRALAAQGYTPERIVRTAEEWYRSIGFAALPETFWERSMLTRPAGREVECHPTAFDIDDREDLRLKACLRVSADDFYTAHHELGHLMSYRAFMERPFAFRAPANDGFDEAIGDFAGLNAMAPGYLRRLGLIAAEPGPEADIPYLLRMALEKVAFLPFGLLVDQWRWQVFSGAVGPARYNEAWWALRLRYQGVAPPGPRPAGAFDPGAKFHVPASVPYARYFLATLYQFQFYRAACRQAGWQGPLNRCAIDSNAEVGARFRAMLEQGASRPWPEALAAFTGETEIDASALVTYFAPLAAWLREENRGRACGW